MCLRYPGSKTKASQLLLSLSPLQWTEYREPFLGSGAMAWLVATRYPDRPMWLNDKHDWVVWYYARLRDDQDFPMHWESVKRRLVSPADKKRAFVAATERLQAGCYDATDFLLINRLSVHAMVGKQRKSIASMSSVFRRDGLVSATAEKLQRIGEILRRPHVRLTCGDYAPLLDDNVGCWLYADPPYYTRTPTLYHHSFTHSQHCELAERINSCGCKIMVTLNHSRATLDLYKGWRVRTHRYTGSLPHRQVDPFKDELILTNY